MLDGIRVEETMLSFVALVFLTAATVQKAFSVLDLALCQRVLSDSRIKAI